LIDMKLSKCKLMDGLMELLTEDVKNVMMTDTGRLMCFLYFTQADLKADLSDL